MAAHAVLFTIYNRPEYLAPVLDSWEKVRDLDDWTFQFRFEPSPKLHKVADLVENFIRRTGIQDVQRVVNTHRLGVLLCPYIGFEHLFQTFDFVMRAEDDVIVSDDILEYFEWAQEDYAEDDSVAAVCAASKRGPHQNVHAVSRRNGDGFNPLNWGTWKDRWQDYIGPTWDKDYSTFNGRPGNQAGWDWNLATRVFPAHHAGVLLPLASRVDNIGLHGTHSTEENFYQMPSFQVHHGAAEYYEV